MDVTALLTVLLHGNQLKRVTRTGWTQRGVPDAESVATHSYGVALATLVLAQVVDEPVDLAQALSLAVLHDLPEALTTDIPSPAWRYLPAGVKTEAERKAMADILDGLPFGESLLALWEELHTAETAEARLVHDADKIDLYLQALIYQEQTGNRHLDEFWAVPAAFHFPQAEALYQALRARRLVV
ncbi:MAG: HD domain-containing protein [Chloroflexi bacterium]|nr:HD domain-containing protein [Chloroflexota bacterium]MCI0577399.1 HD domain-containing protein [Chloroflexota bacterium]MCI0647695.1 HD domain-containing protein [Chloroflexota bacterium]MCI0726576.1 HD domain-containing protein [Chloroflexota bacterium]